MIDLYMLCADLKISKSHIRQKANENILKIYQLLNNPSPKTQLLTIAWKENFQYIYGDIEANLSSNRKLNIEELLSKYGIYACHERSVESTLLLFYAIQTYFSLLIKTIMYKILNSNNKKISSFQDIILGSFATKHGIKNYCNPDFFCWPLFELDNGFQEIITDINDSISLYKKNISLSEFSKHNNYDLIKQIYEAIIPKELRHALGEYYTPDWLAEETLIQTLQFNDNLKELRFLDPTCGSGTFLFKVILEKRKANSSLENILSTVYGVDINPLAVLTAKTNYLLSIIDLIKKNISIEIPVYNVDIIKTNCKIELNNNQSLLTCKNPAHSIFHAMEHDRNRLLCLNKVDIVIGNPPWVNWEYMPELYRKETQQLWLQYQLFNAKGRELSFSKEDISVLITYIVIDNFLRDDGILAFVIRQGVFKSAQNGAGFRKFRVKDAYDLKVLKVDDLSKIKAFDNATNSTAILYLKKGAQTEYPVRYILWEKRSDIKRITFNAYSELQEVKSQVTQHIQMATPAVKEDITSIWMTDHEEHLERIKSVLGNNNYRARTGVFTGGSNAIYWMNILSLSEDYITVTNIVERAKRKSEKIISIIEHDHVYPMLKGSNVKKWKASYDTYLLCPHTIDTKMWPVTQTELQKTCPKTYQYLEHFRHDLNCRKGFAGWEKEIQAKEFHSILRVGEYTFSKYKIVWKYIATEFICAVISSVNDHFLGEKILIPNEKIMYISTNNEDEAYYICGLLSSTIIATCVKSYMTPTSISAHILNKINIPQFDKNNIYHMKISELCKEGHSQENILPYIKKIDDIMTQIYS